MEHLKSAKNKALSNHPLPPKQTLSNNFPVSISEISIQALKSPEPLQSTNSKFSHTFMPQKKNSLTDFTIMHMDTYSPEQMSSPSRYEDSYEIIPDEEYMATASVFNDVDGSQRKEYVYVHQEEYGVGSGNRVEQVQWGTGNLLSDQVTQNYGGNGTGNGREVGRNAGKFKPSGLFTIVEKVSKEKGNKDDGNSAVNYGRSKGNQGVLEPKKTTVNLMDLIKSYTNNPNLERKIKMNKTSFLTNNTRSAHDKENYSDSQNSETVKNGLRQKGSAKSSVERKQCKDNQQLPWVKKENEYLSAKSSKSASKSVRKPLLANSRRSRSKSGEKLDTKLLNQSFQDNIVTLASQMRSLSSNKRRSGSSVFNSESSLVLGSDGVNNSSVMSREQDQIISTLNETMQKLLKKTEINNQELERLKQIKESETQKIQTNQAKLNDLLSQHEAMTAENLYNQDFLAQQSENLLLKGPFQYCVRKDSRSSSYSKQSVQGTEDKNLDKVLKIKMEELNQVRSLLSNLQSGNSTVKPEERIKVATGTQKNSKGFVPAQPANKDSSFIRMSYRKMHDYDSGSASSSITSLGR